MNHAKQMALAYEIADALDDRNSVDMHVRFVKKYSEEFLREQLEYTLGLPDSAITSSRAACYVNRVQRGGYKARY